MKYLDEYNIIVGGIITFVTMIFGEHYFLFLSFIILNIIDYITGIMKAQLTKTENSVKGWKGIIKKLGYWLMILVSFLASKTFIDIGKVIGINLNITVFLGWYVLGTFIINELRSIVENFVEAGFEVPLVLANGLEVAHKTINQEMENEDEL